MMRRQRGFSLVEIAIVLVIIGLLVGSILKGQEMMSSAKVRNLADTTSAVQTAYFGFVDRYQAVPGDMNSVLAGQALGVAVVGGGNDNGRVDNPPGATVYNEPNALWEHLTQSGFLQGAYLGTPAVEPDTTNNLAPLNSFNNVMTIGRTPDYMGSNPVGLNVGIGRGIPVKIIQELDIKLDDGVPDTGILRASAVDGTIAVFSGTHTWGGSVAGCVTSTTPMIWNIAGDAQDCNAIVLF